MLFARFPYVRVGWKVVVIANFCVINFLVIKFPVITNPHQRKLISAAIGLHMAFDSG